ncbi:glycoside hydrolase family 57 protein, partial [Candidatus Saccharibacteria bacterium]|nr:glycoside hydrolase family 57 protein [Candidatus Saccharibacteria bacterium]
MSKSIVLYLHAHQPWRVKPYSVFDAVTDHVYFNDESPDTETNNRFIIDKVSEKSYLPTNAVLKDLLLQYPNFKVSLSITGTLIEQLEVWRPDVLQSFKDIVATGKVEIVAETYYHSLAFFYSRAEFVKQVSKHAQKIQDVFGVMPTAFRNTELSYNNDLAYWADEAGYKAIITEGWDPVLGWRSPNYVYRPSHTENIRLLMKNYRLSDDVAFRFSDRNWSEWPLTTEKYCHWLSESDGAGDVINLFMDYETFGEHQWADTGIFDFLRAFPAEWLKTEGHDFKTITEAVDSYEAIDFIDVPQTITWADTERDLTAWLGNPMQHDAVRALYRVERQIIDTQDADLINDWRKLQTSDHLYYMCTKWFSDGDVHAYFSPYSSPYDAFRYFMNAWRDMQVRLLDKGVD